MAPRFARRIARARGLFGKKVGIEVGLMTAISWLCALVAAYTLPRLSDRTGEGRRFAAAILAVGGIGIAAFFASR